MTTTDTAARLREYAALLPSGSTARARVIERLAAMGIEAPAVPVDTTRAAFLDRYSLREKTDDEWLMEIGEDEVRANLDALRADVAANHDRLNPGEARAKERARKRGEDVDAEGWTPPARRKRMEAPDWADPALGQRCADCGREFEGGDWLLVATSGRHVMVCGRERQGDCWRRLAPPADRGGARG